MANPRFISAAPIGCRAIFCGAWKWSFPSSIPICASAWVQEILPAYLADCVKARVLGSDGVYTRSKVKEGKGSQAQLTFRNLARDAASRRVDPKSKKDEKKLLALVPKPPLAA